MKTEPIKIESDQDMHGTPQSYVIGFLLSIILTFVAYYLVVENILAGWQLDGALAGLCLAQVAVQFVFFLHLMDEAKPRNNLLIFLFMVLVIVILVGGTLWIMNNLDYRMMTDMNMDH